MIMQVIRASRTRQ